MLYTRQVLASAALLFAMAGNSRADPSYDVSSCQTSPQIGRCLLDLVRTSRNADELAGHISLSHQKLVQEALKALERSDSKDLDNRLELLLEDAVAADAAEQNDGLNDKFKAVCTAARSAGLTAHGGLLCSYAEVKIAMMGDDPDAVLAAVDELFKAIPGASSGSTVATAQNLAKRGASYEEQMIVAAALTAYSVAKKKSDLAAAVKASDSAIEILLPFAEKSQIDLTTASEVATAATAIVPQPWDAEAKDVDALPLIRRAAHLSELAFGKDNPRIFDYLYALEFHIWNSSFGTMETELKESKELQKKEDSGNPLTDLANADKITSADQLEECKALINRLYQLTLGDSDVARQEKRLENLASSVGTVDDMRPFLVELLEKRAKLIEQAITQGKLPISLKYESLLRVAENDLLSEEKKAAALVTIDDISDKLARMNDEEKQLPRALLAEVTVRAAAVKFGKSPTSVQLPKAEAALGRADLVIQENQPDAGADMMDLLQAQDTVKEMKERK